MGLNLVVEEHQMYSEPRRWGGVGQREKQTHQTQRP
jgi:hypothetical protein